MNSEYILDIMKYTAIAFIIGLAIANYTDSITIGTKLEEISLSSGYFEYEDNIYYIQKVNITMEYPREILNESHQ